MEFPDELFTKILKIRTEFVLGDIRSYWIEMHKTNSKMRWLFYPLRGGGNHEKMVLVIDTGSLAWIYYKNRKLAFQVRGSGCFGYMWEMKITKPKLSVFKKKLVRLLAVIMGGIMGGIIGFLIDYKFT